MKKLGKSPALHVVMILIWAILACLLWYFYVSGIISLHEQEALSKNIALYVTTIVLLVLNGIFITYFWLNGVKDFLYMFWYWISHKRLEKGYEYVLNQDVSEINDKVIMLYCTCNDFEGECLELSMQQHYSNVETIILDDSSKQEYKDQVNEFAAKHGLKVIRRKDRKGFKAGNINNYLKSEEARSLDYKYIVILDSDEIIPHDFISKCLQYFKGYDNVGIVQCTHIATRNRNFFQNLFHIGVNSHWNCYQTMKDRYGFSSMLGHGAMIRRECYEKAGGFPEMVAEDLCLSIEMKNVGYTVAFAPNIVCQEEYPIDYIAFKKRHSKWTQGNLEFIKGYTGKILKSKMHWWEKLDIFLFTYNLPLTALFGFYMLLNLVILPLLNVDLSAIYSVWMLIPTIVFFFSPTLNDFLSWFGRMNVFKYLLYFVCVVILYGSMLLTSLISALLGTFGKKAVFIVTPKNSDKITFIQAIKYQWKELIFAVLLLIISFWLNKSALPVILISGTSIFSMILVFFSNKKYDVQEMHEIDVKSSKVTIRQNALIKSDVDLPGLGLIPKKK